MESVCDASADEVSVSAGGVLCEYAEWLTRERGLAPVTANNYCWNVRQFLAALPQPVTGLFKVNRAGARW